MESFKNFDPRDPKYKTVDDLPNGAHYDFADSENDPGVEGFVRKEAYENDDGAEYQAYLNKRDGTGAYSPKEILHGQAIREEEARIDMLERLQYLTPEKLKQLGNFDRVSLTLSKVPGSFHIAERLTILKNNPTFFKEAVAILPEVLEHASPEIKNNKDIALIAVSTKGEAIKFVSPRLQEDRDVISTAISQNPNLSDHYISDMTIDQFIEDDEK